MDGVPKLPHIFKTIAIRLAVQGALLAVCMVAANYLACKVPIGEIVQSLQSSSIAKILAIEPDSHIWHPHSFLLCYKL